MVNFIDRNHLNRNTFHIGSVADNHAGCLTVFKLPSWVRGTNSSTLERKRPGLTACTIRDRGRCCNTTVIRKDAGLCCGPRLLEGRSVCLCWAPSKPKRPKGPTPCNRALRALQPGALDDDCWHHLRLHCRVPPLLWEYNPA